MHFFRAGFPDHPHDLLGRRATHNGIVNEKNPLAFQKQLVRVQLQPNTHVPNGVRWFDEGTPDIMIADDA